MRVSFYVARFFEVNYGGRIIHVLWAAELRKQNYGDPLSGYIVWAVNGAGTAYNKEIFPEGLVVSLLPAPPAPAPPGTRSAFLTQLEARDEG